MNKRLLIYFNKNIYLLIIFVVVYFKENLQVTKRNIHKISKILHNVSLDFWSFFREK